MNLSLTVFTEKSNRVFIALRAKEAADTQPDDGAVLRFPFVVWRHKIVNVCNSQFGLHVITVLVQNDLHLGAGVGIKQMLEAAHSTK